MGSGVGIASSLVEFGIDTERQHQELLKLISEGGSIDNSSSVRMLDEACGYGLI
jgi:hypothetical protein